MEQLKELMGLVLGRVEKVAKSDIVVGDPITMGDVTIVPLSRLTMGFGGGGGEGEGEAQQTKRGRSRKSKGKGKGGGSGMGAKVRPVGVVVFGPDGVDVHPIPAKKGLLDKIFDRIPEVIELAQEATGGKSGVKGHLGHC